MSGFREARVSAARGGCRGGLATAGGTGVKPPHPPTPAPRKPRAPLLWLGRLALVGALLCGAATASADVGRQDGGGELTFGETVTDTLDDANFRRVYAFSAQANDVISLSMTRLTGDLDPFLLLTDEHGAILALSDDDGPGPDAQIHFKRLPADGRYFVIATRFGQELGATSGEYALLLERVGTGTETDSVLRYGESVVGRVTPQEPLVFYFLRAERGDVFDVVMRRTSGDLDPQVDIATVDGVVLASNDDDPQAEGTLDAAVRHFTALESGTYLVVATRFGREAGDTEGSFVLSVELVPPETLGASPQDARLVDYGQTLSGEIDDDVPARYFWFQGQRGDVITATLANVSGNLDPLLQLADANLVTLMQDDDGGDGRDARIAAFTLPATGTYYLVATRSGGVAGQTHGEFSLTLSGRPGIGGGRALEINYGATLSGLIDDRNVSEEYVFLGSAGDVIRVRMERASGDLDALVTLYDSDRKQIAFDDDSGGDKNALIQSFTLPRDGMYILVASRYEQEQGTTSGAYLLTLELIRSGN